MINRQFPFPGPGLGTRKMPDWNCRAEKPAICKIPKIALWAASCPPYFSVKPLFKRFKRFEKSLYDLNSVKPLFRRFKRFEKSLYNLNSVKPFKRFEKSLYD